MALFWEIPLRNSPTSDEPVRHLESHRRLLPLNQETLLKTTTFIVAGARIHLRSEKPITLPESYDASPLSDSYDPPHLVIDVSIKEGFAKGREPNENYPGFASSVDSEGRTQVSRTDAAGWISNSAPEASFTVGESMFSLEAAIRVACSIGLLRQGILLFHSSAVELNGKAHMFAGVSGAGKSTIARLLADNHPEFIKLSDELLALRQNGNRWEAVASPFFAREELPVGRTAPLAGIHLIAQAPEHSRTTMEPGTALPELLRHILTYSNTPTTTEVVLGLAASLITSTPVYRLEFAKRPDVASALR